MKTETIKLTALTLDPKNVRTHSARSIDAIAESLENFGQRKPVVITADNVVVTGNGTVQAATELGWSEITAVRIPADWSAEKIRAFAIADNRTSELSGWDSFQLLEQLSDLVEIEIETVGFTADELDDLIEFRQHPFMTVRMNVEDLKPHPQNYQQHPDDQLEQIVASIKIHGFYRNIVVANDNTILAGHGVVQAAKKMGKKRVPVIQLDIPANDHRAVKIMTSDNEINNMAQVDDRVLTELLREIVSQEGEAGLAGTGFDGRQLAALTMVTRPASEIADFDEAAEWLGMPDYSPGIEAKKIIVSFENDSDREDFAKKLGVGITAKTKSLWWPVKQRNDVSSVKLEDE